MSQESQEFDRDLMKAVRDKQSLQDESFDYICQVCERYNKECECVKDE